MRMWQADFYRRPVQDAGQTWWDLLICDANRSFEYMATCPQSEANSHWLVQQFQLAGGEYLPDVIQVFRPQSLSLMENAGRSLGIGIEATRRTLALKKWLQEKQYSIAVEQLPPVPLPENLWGEEWRFATLPAGDLVDEFQERPIPVKQMPDFLHPLNLGLASTVLVPGVVIYGGRQSMRLVRWLEDANPVSLRYMAGAPDGLVLDAGLLDRWIIATFEDEEVATAAKLYETRKQLSQGLHFLLIQPDDSGMTYSGFWLLQAEN
ncbi:Tab2/Atab2 family RNA-binding protein [Richelia sinica]|nr:Tab2/Atab2 family RNA-binding protein [Richelia sinica]MBD2663789.1 Tab2/Atab2 family RNA-binding protein [Richelia sinica FACHB-800]